MKKGGRIALTAGILLLAACIAVPHISTQHYVWAGITGAEGMKVQAALPADAVLCEISGNPMMTGMIFGFVLASLMFAFSVYLAKHEQQKRGNYRRLGLLTAIVFGMPVHELIHGAALPANAAVRIGFNKEQFIAFAVSDAPMNTAQLCAHFLMPTLLLGILPVCISLMLRKKHPAAQMFFLFFGIGSLIASPIDWVVLTAILRSIPSDAIVQISETVPYWYIR